MDIVELKIKLLQKILECEDEEVLMRILNILPSSNKVLSETGEDYELEKPVSRLSTEQRDAVNEDIQEYLKGKGESETLKIFDKKIS